MELIATKIADQVQVGEHMVGGAAPTFVIAEVGSNHNVDFELAKRLIDVAAKAGSDAVKFQSFRAEWLYPPNCGLVETPMGMVEFFEVLQKSQLPREWLPALKQHADECGLVFLSTPFDQQAVLDLQCLGVSALKIASAELNHLPLLRAAAQTGLTLLASTGLCTLTDIEEALMTVRVVNPDCQLALFQCVAGYPTPPEQCNLGAIETLKRAFGVPVGFSDHTTDAEMVPAIAVAAGADMIEKHFTLDRSLPGPDHPFALEPGELKAMVCAIREMDTLAPTKRIGAVNHQFGEDRVLQVLGHGRKEIMPIEADLYPCDKRSIHALRQISPGDTLSTENMRVLRSERNLQPGLHPRFWNTIIGARATKPILLGEGIQWSHLLQV